MDGAYKENEWDTSVCVTPDGIREIQAFFWKKNWFLMYVLAFGCMFSCIESESRSAGIGTAVVAMIVVIITLIFGCTIGRRIGVKMAVQRQWEYYGRYETTFYYRFCDDYIEQATENTWDVMSYQVFVRCYETKNLALLVTKTKIYLAFDKRAAQDMNIYGLVKSKNPSLK